MERSLESRATTIKCYDLVVDDSNQEVEARILFKASQDYSDDQVTQYLSQKNQNLTNSKIYVYMYRISKSCQYEIPNGIISRVKNWSDPYISFHNGYLKTDGGRQKQRQVTGASILLLILQSQYSFVIESGELLQL